MNSSHFAAIILAGGLSSRMKQFKPLLPLGKETITDYVINTYIHAGIDVILVVGHRQDEIKKALKNGGVNIVYNPKYKEGMFSSVLAGVKKLSPEYQAFFINPVDIPLVRPATIQKLVKAAPKNPDKIIYPIFDCKRGHPPLIPTSLIPGILEWNQDGGLKTFLKVHEEKTFEVPVNDKFILFDINTPADYKKLLKLYPRH